MEDEKTGETIDSVIGRRESRSKPFRMRNLSYVPALFSDKGRRHLGVL